VNVYISADMEGTAGVASWTQCDPSNTTEYPYYRTLMSREVRAAIDGARDAGAKKILVNDSHSAMRNVLWDALPSDVRMIYGNRKPFSMAQGADASFGAAFFTGYHAGIGEPGVLDHTYTDTTIYLVRVNGVRCNEALLNAALLGLDGVPVALVTGDRVAVDGVREHLPWVTGVVTKEPLGRYAADMLAPDVVRERIRGAARTAIERIGEARPYVFAPPISLEIDFAGTANAEFVELMPGFERTGGRSVRFVHDDYRVVFRAFIAAFRLGAAANVNPP
jgi:D-amino peptidase